MKWIRSPWWDILWIWSGFPIGLALVGLYLLSAEGVLLYFFAAAIVLETAHAISPIGMPWIHKEFRKVMWEKKVKFIALPLAVFSTVTAIGVVTSWGWTSFKPGFHQIYRITDWTNPLPLIIWMYLILQVFHFGMQNFGVLTLYKQKNGVPQRRYLDMAICVAVTALGFSILPMLYAASWFFFVIMGVFSVNHWLVEIGLTSHVTGRPWPFIGGVLVIGSVGFIWTHPTPGGNMMAVLPTVLCARIGLQFVHYLYDRWEGGHHSCSWRNRCRRAINKLASAHIMARRPIRGSAP